MTPEPRYRALTGSVVRAPLLAAAAFERLGGQSGAGLDRWWADPEVRFAVAVASPDLAAALAAAPSVGKASTGARAALQRYLIRAATRPTPFGGFAAVGVARWADHTDLEVAPGRRPTRTRADMAWLTEVAEGLSRDPACRPGLRVYANTCAFERDGRIYLADPGTGGVRAGPDVSVRATPVVRRVLTLARAGIAAPDLRRHLLAATPAATPDRVDRLLVQLSDQQFLLPELLPALVGDPLKHVLTCLDGMLGRPSQRLGHAVHHREGGTPGPAATATAAAWSARLTTVDAACRAVDAADPATATAALGTARALLAAIPLPGPPTPAAPPVRSRGVADVQVDAALPLSGTGVNRTIAEDVSRAVGVLFRLHPDPAWRPLAGFGAEFHRRYGEQRRVPLLELLDPRFGLGLPWAHRAGPGDGTGHAGVAGRRREATLRSLVAAAIRDGGGEVVLDDRLIERLSAGDSGAAARLPPSVELSVFVAARSRTAVDRGEYLLVVGPNLGAQAAGRGLGRFADLVGPPAYQALAEAAAEEAARHAAESGAVVAELVYRPVRARSANVAVRPLVRGYELPIGVAPTLPPDRVVHLDEVSVGLRDGRFQVWWDAVDRPLVLVAGHMLNSAAAPAVCRALLELTSDGETQLSGFDWGPMAEMPYLPRVRHGRVVLSPAQWRLGGDDLGGDDLGGDDLGGDDLGGAGFDESLDSWRARWRVPHLVYLASADNRLLLNLDDRSHRAQVRAALNGTRPLVLHEAVPGPGDGWLPGPRGRLIVELVVPLVRMPVAGAPAPAVEHRAAAPTAWRDSERRRPPGSDWLYVTVEGPGRTEDEVLAGSLGDLADEFVERGDADGWFFVRYADPDRHLRLRFRGPPRALGESVLPGLTRWAAGAIEAGLRTRLVLQTYERELERYGGPETTAICEAMACVDSPAVRRLLRLARTAELDRVELGLVSVADLLSSLTGGDPAERARWAKGLARDATARTTGGAVFRERKLRLRSLVRARDDGAWHGLDGAWPDVGGLVGEVLAQRRAALAPLVAELGVHWAGGTGSRSPEELAPSILHLHANRLGLDRSAEGLVLGLLDRTLRSLIAHPPAAAIGITGSR